MSDIKVLLERYREKLIILETTLHSVGAATELELLGAVHLKQDISELELLILEAEIIRLQKAEHNSEYKQLCKNCKHWFDCFVESTNICEYHVKFERKQA